MKTPSFLISRGPSAASYNQTDGREIVFELRHINLIIELTFIQF